MPGVFRSSINLIRWRGVVPNALNAGRVDAVLSAQSVNEGGFAKESSSQSIYNAMAKDATVAKEAAASANYNSIYSAMAKDATVAKAQRAEDIYGAIYNAMAKEASLASYYNSIYSAMAKDATVAKAQRGEEIYGALNSSIQATYNITARESTAQAIWTQITSAGVVVAPGSYVVTKSLQRGDVAVNDGQRQGTSSIATVNGAKAEVRFGGWYNGQAFKVWLYTANLIMGERSSTSGNDIGRYEVEEKP